MAGTVPIGQPILSIPQCLYYVEVWSLAAGRKSPNPLIAIPGGTNPENLRFSPGDKIPTYTESHTGSLSWAPLIEEPKDIEC